MVWLIFVSRRLVPVHVGASLMNCCSEHASSSVMKSSKAKIAGVLRRGSRFLQRTLLSSSLVYWVAQCTAIKAGNKLGVINLPCYHDILQLCGWATSMFLSCSQPAHPACHLGLLLCFVLLFHFHPRLLEQPFNLFHHPSSVPFQLQQR